MKYMYKSVFFHYYNTKGRLLYKVKEVCLAYGSRRSRPISRKGLLAGSKVVRVTKQEREGVCLFLSL